MIIHRGVSAQGVTTAATLWANASVGVAVGLGELRAGTAMFVAIIFVQFTMRHIGMWIARIKQAKRKPAASSSPSNATATSSAA